MLDLKKSPFGRRSRGERLLAGRIRRLRSLVDSGDLAAYLQPARTIHLRDRYNHAYTVSVNDNGELKASRLR